MFYVSVSWKSWPQNSLQKIYTENHDQNSKLTLILLQKSAASPSFETYTKSNQRYKKRETKSPVFIRPWFSAKFQGHFIRTLAGSLPLEIGIFWFYEN